MQSAFRQGVRGVAVLLLVAAAGCASTGTATTETGAAVGSGLTVNIQNDHASSVGFTLFIEPSAGGVRQSLGTVDPGTSPAFTYAAAASGAQYVLIQQTASGDSRSERFTVQGPTTVTWDLNTRRLTVTRR